MAEHRMFAKSIIQSARFLRMPPSSRLLYYDIGMACDDDGIAEAYTVMKMTGATEDDLKVLLTKGFVKVLNDDLVTWVVDWRTNNIIRKERYKASQYRDLLLMIVSEEEQLKICRFDSDDTQVSPKCHPKVDGCVTQDKISKDKIRKDKILEEIVPFDSDEIANEKKDELAIYVANEITTLNADTLDEILSFRDCMPDELIHYGVNESLKNGVRTAKYLISILRRWANQGYKSVADVKAEEEKRAAAKVSKEQSVIANKQQMITRDIKESDFDFRDSMFEIMNRKKKER